MFYIEKERVPGSWSWKLECVISFVSCIHIRFGGAGVGVRGVGGWEGGVGGLSLREVMMDVYFLSCMEEIL